MYATRLISKHNFYSVYIQEFDLHLRQFQIASDSEVQGSPLWSLGQ